MRLPLAATLALLAVPALAQDIVYTGCLKLSDGSLYYIREGTSPMAQCKAKDKPISWNMAGQPGPEGPPGPPLDITVNVDCQEGQSINAALAQPANSLTVLISGSCEEGVSITRDNVTLQGVDPTPTITAPAGEFSAIRILGAHHVRLRNLHVAGGVHSVRADSFASFEAWNLRITGGSCGICLINSSAYVNRSEISRHDTGTSVDTNSFLILEDSWVIDNAGTAIQVGGGLSLSNTEVARNSAGIVASAAHVEASGPGCAIRDNPGGVLLYQSRLTIGGGCVVEGSYYGIEADFGSSAQLNDVTIQGNTGGGVVALGGSNIFLVAGAPVIKGGPAVGVTLYDTSTLGWVGGDATTTTITGTDWGVYCAGPPSVAQVTWRPLPGVITNCPPGP